MKLCLNEQILAARFEIQCAIMYQTSLSRSFFIWQVIELKAIVDCIRMKEDLDGTNDFVWNIFNSFLSKEYEEGNTEKKMDIIYEIIKECPIYKDKVWWRINLND